MDRLNNSYQPKSEPPRHRMAFGCALKADNLLPAELYRTYRTTKKTITPKIPKSSTKPKPAPVSAYHQLVKPKYLNTNANNPKPDSSEKSCENQARVVKKPSLKQIRRTPIVRRKVENVVVAEDNRGAVKENRIAVYDDSKLAMKQLPKTAPTGKAYVGPMLYKSRPINISDFSENSEIEISSWSPILLEKGASKFLLPVENQTTAAEKTKNARRGYRMIHYTKKFKPRKSSEIFAKGVGFENPPKKAKAAQPAFRTYYNYSQHVINEDKRSTRAQPVVEESVITDIPQNKTRRTRNPLVTEMLSQWVSNYLPPDTNSNVSNIKGGSWIALSKTDINTQHSKQQSTREILERQRIYEQKKALKESKKKKSCRARTYYSKNSSVTVDNFSSDQSRRKERRRKKNFSSVNSTMNGHNLVVCRFGTWRKCSKPKWNNLWTKAARRCGGFSKSFKHNCGPPMRKGLKIIKSMKFNVPVSKSYIDKKLEELTKKHVQQQQYGSVNSSSLESKTDSKSYSKTESKTIDNSNETSSGSNRATIGSSEVSSMTQSSQIIVQNYHSQQESPTGTLKDVSGTYCKIVPEDPNSSESTTCVSASCACLKKPSRTNDCECARTANVGTSIVEMKPEVKPDLKKLVESITNNDQTVYQQTNVVTKTEQDPRASQRASKKSMHLTIMPRERKITLRKNKTEVISVPVFRAPNTNHSCATIPCTKQLKFTEPKITSISSNSIRINTRSGVTSKSSFVSAGTQVEQINTGSSEGSVKSANTPCKQSSTLVPVPSINRPRFSRASNPARKQNVINIQAMTIQSKASEDKQYSRASSPIRTRKCINVQELEVAIKADMEKPPLSTEVRPSPSRKPTDFQALAVQAKQWQRRVNKLYNLRTEKFESTTILVPTVEKAPSPPLKKRKPDEISRIYYSPAKQRPKTILTQLAITAEPQARSKTMQSEISSALEFSNTFPASASYPKVVICRSGSWRRRPPWRKMWTKAVKGVTFWSRSCADAARKKSIKPENVIIIDQETKDTNNSKGKPALIYQNTYESVKADTIKNVDHKNKIMNSRPEEKNSELSSVIRITNLDRLPKSALSSFRPSKTSIKANFPSGRQYVVESGTGSGNIRITFASTDPIHALSDENNRAVQISNKPRDESLSVDASIGNSDNIQAKKAGKYIKAPILDKENKLSLISTIQRTKSLTFDDTDNLSVSALTCQLSLSTLDTLKVNTETETLSPKSILLRDSERKWSITEPKLLSISSAELKCAAMVTSANAYNNKGIQAGKKLPSDDIQVASTSPLNTETVQSLIDYLATTTGRRGASSSPQSVSDRVEVEDPPPKPPSTKISLTITLNTNSRTYSETPQVQMIPGVQALEFPKKEVVKNETSSSLSPMKWINADDKEQPASISEDLKASAVTTFVSNAATQYSTPVFKNHWNKIDERRVLNCSVQTSRESRHYLYEQQHEERKVYHCSVQTPNNKFQSYNVETDPSMGLPHKRTTWGCPARCFPQTSWRSSRERAYCHANAGRNVKTQTEVYALEKCPKCRTRLMKFGDEEEENETLDYYFKNHLMSSCQYYTSMFCKRIEQFKENLVRTYTMKRNSESSNESDSEISPAEENCQTMIQETSHSSTTTEIQTQKTKLYASKDDTFLYSMRISNCTTTTDYVKLQKQNCLAVTPRASTSCCELGSNLCSMDMSGEHNRKNLNYVYYLFTAIEGRIRRII